MIENVFDKIKWEKTTSISEVTACKNNELVKCVELFRSQFEMWPSARRRINFHVREHFGPIVWHELFISSN